MAQTQTKVHSVSVRVSCLHPSHRATDGTSAPRTAASANHAALQARARIFAVAREAAPPPLVGAAGGDALAHEHARAGRGLEDVVDALDLEGRALLVGAGADLLGDALRLGAGDVLRSVRVVRWRAEVDLAADEDDGDGGAADGADFLYPLITQRAFGRAFMSEG